MRGPSAVDGGRLARYIKKLRIASDLSPKSKVLGINVLICRLKINLSWTLYIASEQVGTGVVLLGDDMEFS